VTENGLRLAEAVVGQDAVISALGRGTSLRSTGLIQQSVPVILSAMRAHRVCRLIFTSAIGVGGDLRGLPLVSRLMTRWVLTNIYRDKAGGESLIRASDLDWTLVQPSQLTNGPVTGSYRVGEGLALRGMPRIARADVAHFILSQLDDPTYIRKVVRISH
jgi:putative NADH-flavin reductase